VPVKMKLHSLVQDEQLNFLTEMIGESAIVYDEQIPGEVKGRFVEINFDKEITLECGNVADKQSRYSQLLISMLSDQWNWIRDRDHKRTIDETNAVESLRMAEQATKISLKY